MISRGMTIIRNVVCCVTLVTQSLCVFGGSAGLPFRMSEPQLSCSRNNSSSPLDNIRVMVIVWSLRGNIIRTAPCWVVWHSVHSQQHTHMSSSYRSSRLGLSHWDPYAMHRGGCLELYYCNMVEWSWWDSSLIWRPTGFLQCFDTVGLVIWPVKIVPEMTYNVSSGTLSLYTTTTTRNNSSWKPFGIGFACVLHVFS